MKSDSKQQPLKQELSQIYNKFFVPQSQSSTLPPFEQIDHGPKQFCPDLFSIQENCLVISYEAFQKYYECLFKELRMQENIEDTLKAANILLAMNGENDQAWNLKKKYLLLQQSLGTGMSSLQGQKQTESQKEYLNLQWELVFNAAVCLKCKKSSSYYEYRLRLIQVELNRLVLNSELNSSNTREELQRILQRQNQLIKRVLARFFRNYFCWMYRVKLIKMIHEKVQAIEQESSQEETQQKEDETSLTETFVLEQLHLIHKFIEKYCNDHSAYSYLIAFYNKYILNKNNDSKLIFNPWHFLKQELKWVEDLFAYCQLAYESNHHYTHLLMYKDHLTKLLEIYSSTQISINPPVSI